MSLLIQKRIAAVKIADAVSAIEGTTISDYAGSLSVSWARREHTEGQIKDTLLAYHRKLADQERRSHV